MFCRSIVATLLLSLVACKGDAAPTRQAATAEPVASSVRLTIIGTSDLHGRLTALPRLGGYVRALRDEAKAAGGAVVLVDAGDMFQGTLESNLEEGASIIQAYSLLGYDAAAIGNHEFDYGPVGPHATPRSPDEDPRGALRALAIAASFPLLLANVTDATTRAPVDWKNVAPSAIVERSGLRIGFVGVTSEDTPHTTTAANLVGLRFTDPAEAIAREAKALRSRGANVVIALAHAGGRCTDLANSRDVKSCDSSEEIMTIAHKLSPDVIDAVVAGHTHQAMAQVVNGIPIVQSWAQGKAFGRIDLTVDGVTKKVTASEVFPPTEISDKTYRGVTVVDDSAVQRAVEPAIAKAKARKAERLGVKLTAPIRRSYDRESVEGNLLADLLRADRADVAILNGGGIRADFPRGELLYGHLFEAIPFDNRVATVTVTGADLSRLIASSLKSKGGILSVSGVRAVARCAGKTLQVALARADGRAIRDADRLSLVTTDFLAAGGDGARFGAGKVTIEETEMRDAIEQRLRATASSIRADDPRVFDKARPRLVYPGQRPVRCP